MRDTALRLISDQHYTCRRPETQLLLTAIADDLGPYMDEHGLVDTDFNEVADGLEMLARLCETEGCTPEKYFEMISYGHFKECYYLSPHFVIKFCAERNPTAEEHDLLVDAFNHGLDDLFVPTWYYSLERGIDSATLEKDDEDDQVYNEETCEWDENPEWHDNTILTHVCIQPRVIVLPEPDNYDSKFHEIRTSNQAGWDWTRLSLGIPADADPTAFKGVENLDIVWARAFVAHYGLARLKHFAQFCMEFHVWDLHGSNVGYVPDSEGEPSKPVILDWMSR